MVSPQLMQFRVLFLAGLIIAVTFCHAQVAKLNVPTPCYAPTSMSAQWITHPDLVGSESAVVLFRRTFELGQKPERFVVNVSADNHYTLFVNGKQVCFGPRLSDIRHQMALRSGQQTLNL